MTEERQLLNPIGWALYVFGSTLPIWLFASEMIFRSMGTGRTISSNLAYGAIAGGMGVALLVACVAKTTIAKRMVFCGAVLPITAISYLLMVAISLVKMGPLRH